jgi:flagellar motor switch protein FliM
MAEELDQNAINNLFREAAAEAEAAAAAPKSSVVNFARRASISHEQMQMLVSVNQIFSQSLGITLSARLNAPVTLTMVATERSLYHNLLDTIDLEASYLGQSRFRAPDARSLIAMDLALVEPLVHLALGGLTTIPPARGPRELTQIDTAIMELLMGIVCTEMNLMWAPFGLQAHYDGRVVPIHARRFYPQSEYVLSFTYEVHVGDRTGSLQIALATVIASALLREVDHRDHERIQPPATRKLLQDRIAGLGVRSTLRLPAFKVLASEILNLQPGHLLESNLPTTTPCLLGMSNGPTWEAQPMLSDERIAAKLIRPHLPSLPQR